MTDHAAVKDMDEPVTLYRIMQTMIGEGLRQHYQPPQKLSHEFFVLLLQLKEQERRRTLPKTVPKAAAKSAPKRGVLKTAVAMAR
jgi:hypothetical protein